MRPITIKQGCDYNLKGKEMRSHLNTYGDLLQHHYWSCSNNCVEIEENWWRTFLMVIYCHGANKIVEWVN